jgi:hypothetical protein
MIKNALHNLVFTFATVLFLAFAATARAQTTPTYTDLWWNPAESGWGINLNQQGDIIFGTWFTYGSNNAAQWFVMSDLRRQADGSFTGPIFLATGLPFRQIFGAESIRSVTSAGTATLRFSGASTGTFSYTIGSVSQTKSITRQIIVADAPTTCTQQSVAASRTAGENYQDLWWVPAESGWGLNLSHQADTIFATWFTYREDGTAQWLVASNVARQADGSYMGLLYRTTGIAYQNINNAAVIQSVQEVGQLTLRFQNGEDGYMSYKLDGIGGHKRIQRQTFGPTVNQCTNARTTPRPVPAATAISCIAFYDFTVGNKYVSAFRQSNGFAGTRNNTIVAPTTFNNTPVLAVEDMQPQAPNGLSGAFTQFFEVRGNTIGVIGSNSITRFNGNVTNISLSDPLPAGSIIDFIPRRYAVGDMYLGITAKRTSRVESGSTVTTQQREAYVGRTVGVEAITTPAGTFNACKFEVVDEASHLVVTVAPALPASGSQPVDYHCLRSRTNWYGAIGTIRTNNATTSCTGTFSPGTTAANQVSSSITELQSAMVNGRAFP